MKSSNNSIKKETSNGSKQTSLKSRIGLGLIVLGFISPVFGLIVPLFNLPSAVATGLIAFFLVGAPEIFLIAGAALAGKEGLLLVKNRIKRMLGLPEGTYAATKGQYTLAKVLLLLWLVTVILPYYAPSLVSIPFIADNLIYFSAGGDILLIVTIFFIGGNQMVTKIGNLFTWEPWQLPEKKQATTN